MSTDFRMVLTNKQAVIDDLKAIQQDVQDGVIKALKEGGKEITNGIKESLPVAQTIADMSAYDREGYIRSVPGGKPMVQTGTLRDSIFSKIMPLMLGEAITLKISTFGYAFYGHMLEFGTSKMAARPWFYDGILKHAPYLKDHLVSMLDSMVKHRNELRPGYIRRKRMTWSEGEAQHQLDLQKLEDFKAGTWENFG